MSSSAKGLSDMRSQVCYSPSSGALAGTDVAESRRLVSDLTGVFFDEQARCALPQERLAYRVECHFPVSEGTAGGLFFGTSYIEPGMVGDEYMMTKGHFHSEMDTGEYYWCIAGEGALILMDESRRCWVEQLGPGSLHYIPGRVAHRLANTGEHTLVVGACWPSNAGHDYTKISEQGFSARLRQVDGTPQLIPER